MIFTYDIVSRITVSGAYSPILLDVGIPNLVR